MSNTPSGVRSLPECLGQGYHRPPPLAGAKPAQATPASPSAGETDAADRGVLVGRLGPTDLHGNPICASVRPPLIEWSAATERHQIGPPLVAPDTLAKVGADSERCRIASPRDPC